MADFSSTDVYFDSECWFFDGSTTCPESTAGSGYPVNPIIFVHPREEKKLDKQVKRKIKQIRKKHKSVSKESIKAIIESEVEQWNPQPTIDEYQLEYNDALKRYRIYLEWKIQQIEDEEIALILIFANIL